MVSPSPPLKSHPHHHNHRSNRLRRTLSVFLTPKLLTKEVLFIFFSTISIILYALFRTHEYETCYGSMLDAGSSGTKVSVFSFPCMRTSSVPRFDLSKTMSKKFPQPLASFEHSTSSEFEAHIASLINFIDQIVPTTQRSRTPIILGATAGMRLIPQSSQIMLTHKVSQILSKSAYYFPETKSTKWCRVISGEEEGAYLWATVNYLLNYLSHRHSKSASTVATIDLGGASTQIAFIPQHYAKSIGHSPSDFEMVIKWLNQWRIYTVSYLGFGKRKASELILFNQIQPGSTYLESACHFKGYTGEHSVNGTLMTIIGAANFQICSTIIGKYVTSRRFECEFESSEQCALHRVYESAVPPHMQIYGASGVASAAHFLGFKSSFTLAAMLKEIESTVFSLDWQDVQLLFPNEDELPSRMFLTLYVHHLLFYGYNIHPTREIYVPDQINHVTLGWSLAFFMQQVSEISCKELLGDSYCMQTVQEATQFE